MNVSTIIFLRIDSCRYALAFINIRFCEKARAIYCTGLAQRKKWANQVADTFGAPCFGAYYRASATFDDSILIFPMIPDSGAG